MSRRIRSVLGREAQHRRFAGGVHGVRRFLRAAGWRAQRLLVEDVAHRAQKSTADMLGEFGVGRIGLGQAQFGNFLSKLDHRGDLRHLLLAWNADLLIAEVEHDAGQVAVPALRDGAVELLDRPAGGFLRGCARAFPHDADEDVVVDRDLAVDDILGRPQVRVRVRLVPDQFQGQLPFRRQKRQHIVDVTKQTGQRVPFVGDITGRGDEDLEDPRPGGVRHRSRILPRTAYHQRVLSRSRISS